MHVLNICAELMSKSARRLPTDCLSLQYTNNPMSRHFIATALLVFAAVNAKAQKKPNILFILADDLGWKDLGCTGSDYYETPNIDRIAAEGMRFTQSYAACQVSSPSRASILTGQYPVRHGITNWIGEPSGEAWRGRGRHSKLLPADYALTLSSNEVTLPEVLRSAGYATLLAGKWHLGGEGSMPEDHGFEVNIGGHEAGGPYPGGYFSPYGNPKMSDGPRGEELNVRLARETAKFIEECHGRPFFAYLSFYAVHAPIETTEANWRHFRDKAVKGGVPESGFAVEGVLPARQRQDNPVYAGLVRQMDDAVGVVLDKLTELGLDENTIVIFTSDNGGVCSGDDYATSNRPLRGGKGQQWEGGLRVPLLVRYPGLCLAGSECDTPISGMDFYPTLLRMVSVGLPREQKVDGIDFSPLFRGRKVGPRALYWHYPHYGNQGGAPSSVIREGDWKLIRYYEEGRDELYNLAADPAETRPVNELHPRELSQLQNKLTTWLCRTGALFPIADREYDPEKERAYVEKMQRQKMTQLEALRRDILRPDYRPNADWWGSSTED